MPRKMLDLLLFPFSLLSWQCAVCQVAAFHYLVYKVPGKTRNEEMKNMYRNVMVPGLGKGAEGEH